MFAFMLPLKVFGHSSKMLRHTTGSEREAGVLVQIGAGYSVSRGSMIQVCQKGDYWSKSASNGKSSLELPWSSSASPIP